MARLAGGSACPASPISSPAPTSSAACALKARVRARPSTSGSARCLCTTIELEAHRLPPSPIPNPAQFRVPMALHETNRVKLAEMMPKGSRGVALLQGGDQQTRYDTDHEPVFRQESYFQYLFGVSEAGCFGAVSLPRSAHALHCLCTLWTLSEHSETTLRGPSLHALHPLRTLSAPSSHPLYSARATLFVPELGEEYEVFCGRYPSPQAFKAAYGVEEAHELPAWPPPSLPPPLLPPHPHLRRHCHPRPRFHPRPHFTLIFTSTLNLTLALTLTPHLAPTRCATCASSPRGSRSNWAPRARYTCSTVRTATRATTRCPPPSRETMPSPPARTRRRSSRQRPRRA